MDGLKLAVDGIGVLFSLVIAIYYFTSLLGEPIVLNKTRFAVYGACIIILTAATLLPNRHIFLPVLNIGLLFLLSFLFRKKWHIRLFYTFLLSILFLISEEFVVAILVFVTSLDVESLQDNILLYIVGLIASRLLMFLLVKIIWLRKSNVYSNIPTSAFIGLILTPISSFAAIATLGISLMYQEGRQVMLVLLCTSVLLCISNFFVFYIFDNQMKSEHTKTALSVAEKQIEYYKDMSRRQSEIRVLSHDIKHFMSGLWGYINEGKLDEANQCIEDIITGLKNADSIYDTGHSALDAVLHAKKLDMDKYNIRFDLFVSLPEQLSVNVIDLCIILGNGLDNAIEACAKLSGDLQRYIRLNMRTEHKYIFIGIENPTSQITGKFPKTSKPDSFYHGLGLKSIKAVTDKYDGSFEVSSLENVFRLSAMVKNA